MKRLQTYLLPLAAALLLSAAWLDYNSYFSTAVAPYAKALSAALQASEQELDALMANEGLMADLIFAEGMDDARKQELGRILASMANEDYTLLAYRDDSLVLWNNNATLPNRDDLSLSTTPSKSLTRTKNGVYLLIRQHLFDREGHRYMAYGFVPLRWLYELESTRLRNEFAFGLDIPESIRIVRNESDGPVRLSDGRAICYLEASGPFQDARARRWVLWLYAFALALFLAGIRQMAGQWAAKGRRWAAALLVLGTALGVLASANVVDILSHFPEVALNQPRFDSLLTGPSILSFMLHIAVLGWVVLFFYRHVRLPAMGQRSATQRSLAAVLAYFLIIAGVGLSARILHDLVFSSQVPFDFENIFKVDYPTLIGLVCVVLALLALFVYSHYFSRFVYRLNMALPQRMGALLAATLLSLPLMYWLDFEVPVIEVLLFSAIYLVLFDIFVEADRFSLTWVMAWLLFFSTFISILFFHYNHQKDLEMRLYYARELAMERDTSAERMLHTLGMGLSQDELLKQFITTDFSKEELEERIEERHALDLVLSTYEYDYHVFYKDSVRAIPGETGSYTYWQQQYMASSPTTQKLVRAIDTEDEAIRYLLPLRLIGSDNKSAVDLFFTFERNDGGTSSVYSALFDDPFAGLTRLRDVWRYEFAYYKNGQLLESDSKTYARQIDDDSAEPGTWRYVDEKGRSELIYQAQSGKVVFVGKEKGNTDLGKLLSLFSHLFGIMVLVLVSLLALNMIFKVLPFEGEMSFSGRPSLRNRIQISVIAVIVLSFFVIGFVTIYFFRNSSEEYHLKRLERKASSVVGNAERDVELLGIGKDSVVALEALAKPLKKIHRSDVNIYDLSGHLIISSESEIFEKGLIAPQMGALAYYELSVLKRSEAIEEERIGDMFYNSAYLPLNNARTGTIAYLGLPYYSKQANLRNDETDFMGALLNVYVFLLLIAGLVAIFIANSITRPLARLGEKLREVALGKRNEPLEWKGDDELGSLIAEYNNMLHKLEESALKLSQSERDSAWREMAKQVAHEIKNPLTPMKLSIQYLLHAYNSSPERAGAMIQRVASTTIEQIDNLARIATEFSNFAKMPKAENSHFKLNDLLESVHDLFSERKDMDFSIDLPEEAFVVYADKDQLMRVFNNVIQNATQAIPEDRRGRIAVELHREGQMAHISIRDNGSGIPDEMREFIFVPNFTTKNSGTGLGLAICKNIVDAVDGRIYFETEKDKGTTFVIELPIVKVLSAEAARDF